MMKTQQRQLKAEIEGREARACAGEGRGRSGECSGRSRRPGWAAARAAGQATSQPVAASDED